MCRKIRVSYRSNVSFVSFSLHIALTSDDLFLGRLVSIQGNHQCQVHYQWQMPQGSESHCLDRLFTCRTNNVPGMVRWGGNIWWIYKANVTEQMRFSREIKQVTVTRVYFNSPGQSHPSTLREKLDTASSFANLNGPAEKKTNFNNKAKDTKGRALFVFSTSFTWQFSVYNSNDRGSGGQRWICIEAQTKTNPRGGNPWGAFLLKFPAFCSFCCQLQSLPTVIRLEECSIYVYASIKLTIWFWWMGLGRRPGNMDIPSLLGLWCLAGHRHNICNTALCTGKDCIITALPSFGAVPRWSTCPIYLVGNTRDSALQHDKNTAMLHLPLPSLINLSQIRFELRRTQLVGRYGIQGRGNKSNEPLQSVPEREAGCIWDAERPRPSQTWRNDG